MKKTWMSTFRRKLSALLVCSMVLTQLGAAAPGRSLAASENGGDGTGSAETVTLRGRIVSLVKGYDVIKDMDLRLYVNGRPDTSRRPVFIKAEDSREPFDLFDDSVELINDLGGAGSADPDRMGVTGSADLDRMGVTGSADLASTSGADSTAPADARSADYEVWEYRFEDLPFEDKDGNEYEYTIRDAARGTATPSDLASPGSLDTSSLDTSSLDTGSLATDSRATGERASGEQDAKERAAGVQIASEQAALYWTDMEGTKILAVNSVEFPAGGARLVYVPYTDVEGAYVFTGAEDRDPDQVTLEAGCVREEDEAFLEACGDKILGAGRDGSMEALLDAERGSWSIKHVPGYNPLTCEKIDYRVEAVSGYEDYQIRYENRGRYAGQEGALVGGTIYHEAMTSEASVTYSVTGTVSWDDRDNLWGLRPDSADFLRVYDAAGNDVTDRLELHTERAAGDVWSFQIDGLLAGQQYRIGQNLPAYDAEAAPDTSSEHPTIDQMTVNIGEIREELKTVAVRGLIEWSGWNPAAKPVKELDFLRVYRGSQDVTGLVTLELVSDTLGTEDGAAVWAYTVEGLPESQTFTIRAEAPEGYAVFPSEIRTDSGMGRYLRNMRGTGAGAGMLEVFRMRNREPAILTIENVYHGQEAGDPQQEFTYILETGSSAETAGSGQMSLWNGGYEIEGEGGASRSETASDGKILLKENEKAKITLTVGSAYRVKQKVDATADHTTADHWILYDMAGKQTQQGFLSGEEENDTKTFINLKKQTLSYQKVWNDNNNAGGKQPEAEQFSLKLDLQVEKAGQLINNKAELQRLGLGDPVCRIDSTGAVYWAIHYDHLPVTDENGEALAYDLLEQPVAGYKSSEAASDSAEYEKKLINTSYTSVSAVKRWQDDNNAAQKRDTIEDYANKRLKLFCEGNGGTGIPVGLQTEHSEQENYLRIDDLGQGKWAIEINNLLQFSEEGIPYAYYLQEDTADWDNAANAGEDHYIASYENPHNYINETTRCYTDGIITNKLEGLTNFTFTKEWKDGAAKPEDRPDITFQLMRYPGNLDPATGYLHAAPVDMKEFKTSEEKEKVTGRIDWIGAGEELLPRYNAEGVKYVYFVTEKLSGDHCSDYVQEVTAADPSADPVLGALDKNLVCSRETLTNRLAKTQDIPVTKTWESAAFATVDAEIFMEVKRKSGAPGAEEETVRFDEAPAITGFSPETLTRTGVIPAMPVYDEDGYPYTYEISEKTVRLKTDKTEAGYVELVWDKAEGVFKTTKSHFDAIQYKFRPETSLQEDGETSITNTLEDTMNVRVDKIWPSGWNEKTEGTGDYKYAAPEQLEFTLYQDGSKYSGTGVDNPVTVPGKDLDPHTPGGEQNGICRFDGLPRYDAKGHEYVYTVKEKDTGSVGLITYRYSWEYGAWTTAIHKEIDTRVVDITNPPPGDGKGFWTEKIWLDDGDKPHRETVQVEVYKKGTDGKWQKTDKTAVLTEENEWRAFIGIEDTEDATDYLVRESALTCGGTEHKAVYETESDGAPAATGMVSTEKHTYEVSHQQENGVWKVTNKRIGNVQVTVTKEWLDDAAESAEGTEAAGDITGGDRPGSARFCLYRTGKGAGGETPEPVLPCKETKNNASQTANTSDPAISWRDLPKYDEEGRLYTYFVEETAVKTGEVWQDLTDGTADFTDSAGTVQNYLAQVTGGEYIHGTGETMADYGDRIPFHAVNRRQETMQVEVYKLWKDDGPRVSGKRVRPDLYFRLYRILKKDLPEDTEMPDPTSDDRFESVSVGKTLDKIYTNDYKEKYVFDPVPRYDEDGHEYVYFAVEGMYGNTGNYQASYYPCTPEILKGNAPPAPTKNMLRLSDGTGTVVNMRDNSVYISGEKIWKLTPGLELKQEDYPGITLRLQSKLAYPTAAEKAANAYKDVTDQAGNTYECTLGHDAGGSRDYKYVFDGPLPPVGAETEGRFPKYDENGRELAYYVKEVEINDEPVDGNSPIYDRTSDECSFILENTYRDTGECSVELTKTWEGVPADAEGPAATIELWRVMVDEDGKELSYSDKLCRSAVIDYNTLNTSDKQVIRFENLPKFAPNARLYHYYIKEKAIGGYTFAIDIGQAEKITFGEENSAKASITNTYEPEDADTHGAITRIEGIKHWSASSLEYGLIPDLILEDGKHVVKDIKLELYRSYRKKTGESDPELVPASFTWGERAGSDNGDWSYEVTPDPQNGGPSAFAKYAPNGTEYTYWVKETIAPDSDLAKLYGTGTESGKKTIDQLKENGGQTQGRLELTNDLVTVKLTAEKHWDDSDNLYGTRPESLTLTVQRRPAGMEGDTDWTDYEVNGTPVTVQLKPGTGVSAWTGSKALPRFDRNDDGNSGGNNGGSGYAEYEYRAVEAGSQVPAGYEKDGDEAHSGLAEGGYLSEVTNRLIHSEDKMELTAVKEWKDENDQDGFRTKAEVTFRLMRRASETDEWSRVDERKLLTATPSDSESHPEADVTLGKYSVTWSNLPKHMPGDNTAAAEYSVQEVITGIPQDIYTSQVAASQVAASRGNSWTVTNTHSPISDIEVTVEKIWKDQGNKWQLRPASVSVVLMRRQGDRAGELARDKDGNYLSADLRPAAGWKKVFTNLPYAANGIPYTYYMVEGSIKNGALAKPSVHGYTSGDQTSFTPVVSKDKDTRKGSVSITNVLETVDIIALKVWTDTEDAYETRPDSVTFGLYRRAGDGSYDSVAGEAEITIAREEFKKGAATIEDQAHVLRYENLPRTDAQGRTYSYQIREVSMKFGDRIVNVGWTADGKPEGRIVCGYKITSTAVVNTQTGNTTQTITNTLGTSVPVRVEKKWDDRNDQDGIRETVPSNIKVTLYRALDPSETDPASMVSMGEKGLEKPDENADGGALWYAQWEDLPLQGPDGTPYYYRAVETLPQDSPYTVSYEPENGVAGRAAGTAGTQNQPVKITMTNTYTPKTMTVRAVKKWSGDDNGIQSKRPTEVVLGLYQRLSDAGDQGRNPAAVQDHNGNPLRTTVNAEVNWEAEWTDLPVYSKGEPITYYVKEESNIPGYITSYSNGNAGRTDGTDFITTGVQGDIAADSNKGDNVQTITITNTWDTRTIYAKKVWNDEENRDGLRANITLRILANGKQMIGQVDKEISKEAVGSEDKLVSWSGLPVNDESGDRITYTVTEVTALEGYETVYTAASNPNNPAGSDNADDPANIGAFADNPLLVTNTHAPAKTAYTVEKLWLGDEEWQEDVRPDSIQMQLYMSEGNHEKPAGAPVTLTPDADGRWKHTWTDLYKYQNQGKVIRYYAKEIGADGYSPTATASNAESGIIANRMKTTSLKVSKDWEDGDDEYGMRPDTIKILLQRRLKGAASWETLPEAKAAFIMERADGWRTVEFTGLPTHNKNDQPYEYRAVEAEIGGERMDHGKAAGYEAVYEHHPNLLTVPGETKITNRLSSGSLEIAKTLKNGAAADFNFRVELTVDGTKTGIQSFTKEITIRSGESIRIGGIPAGTAYTVTELEKTGYIQVNRTGDTGIIEEHQTARAEFVNRRKSSGGGGGGGGGHNKPQDPTGATEPTAGGPGVPTEPGGPTESGGPSEPGASTEPGAPTEPGVTAETETTIQQPTLPDIPTTPEGKPDIPEGTVVEVRDPDRPEREPVYRGSYTGGFENVPSGRYMLITLDDEGVPLANLLVVIDDGGVPLALPKTGDRSIPAALLAAALISSAVALVFLARRRREDEE